MAPPPPPPSSSSSSAAAAAADDGGLDLCGLHEALPPLAAEAPRHVEPDEVGLILCLCIAGPGHMCARRKKAAAEEEEEEPKVADESPGSSRGESPMLRRKGRRKFLSLAIGGSSQLSDEERMGDEME